MHRRKLLTTLFGIGALWTADLPAKDHGNGMGRGRENSRDEDDDDHSGGRHRYFLRQDYGIVQHYYSGPRDLPPGLRKQYYRTGKLPPGWQKKIRPFPPDLVRILPPPPPNCERGYIDGFAVIYDRRTRIILDTLDLIGAIAGH